MTMQSDDMEAIDRYMKTTAIQTPAAQHLKDEWILWWDQTAWWDTQFNADTFDLARNKKNAFNLANAKDEAERRWIAESLKTAFTTEEARGEPRRMMSDGTYSQTHGGLLKLESEESFIPTRVKIAGGILAAVAVTLWGLKKVYVDPFLRR